MCRTICRGLKKELEAEDARLVTTRKIHRKELNNIVKKEELKNMRRSRTELNNIGEMMYMKKTARR